LLTILSVETSQDLHHATVTFSIFPANKSETALKKLSRHIFSIQQLLNKKLLMRPVPKIRFVLNSQESESQKVEILLEKLKNEK
jgi:ribosome-binding factor A